jgi:soluble lytic murein transglycosylase
VLHHRRGRYGVALGIIFFLSLNSCTAQGNESLSHFYEGLRNRQDGAITEAVTDFEQALNSSNAYVAAAAAAELMSLYASGTELTAETMIHVQQRLESDAAGEIAGNATVFRDRDGTPAENAAIGGSLAVARSRYGEAMIFFRIVLRDSPELFFKDPDLLAALGRGFQYTATGNEGVDLFLRWEGFFSAKDGEQEAAMLAAIPPESENLIRFRLLFFAGRIARQRGNPHIELFERALPFAAEVSDEQSDACIWYILNSSLTPASGGIDATMQYLRLYIPQWRNDAYFSDVLDKLSRELVLKRHWESVLQVFDLLKDRSGTAAVQFAWIIGRAIEEGFLSSREISRAHVLLSGGRAANVHAAYQSAKAVAQAYMRFAYDKAADNTANTTNALYYRSLSSAALGEPLLVLSEGQAASQSGKDKSAGTQSDALQFLLGFFEHDAAQFAPRWIKALESGISPEEQYYLAQTLSVVGQYQESMRLISRYAGMDGYRVTRQDMELWYPRPFLELTEQYAQETGIDPALLFGLIRMESAFNHNAVSRAGAIGLTQLMPATAEETAARIRRQGGPDYNNFRDPEANIHIGAAYLAYLNDRMGDNLLALLAYNGGMNRVNRWRRAAAVYPGITQQQLPPDLFLETVEYSETRNYGRNVIAAAAMYRELYYK